MQNIVQQAQKKGIELKDYGRCQFCGSNTKGGVFECFDVFNDLEIHFMDGIGLSQFVFADAHCLQHSEVHGIWNNNLHLTRQYLMLEKEIAWEYSKTSRLSHILDLYRYFDSCIARPRKRTCNGYGLNRTEAERIRIDVIQMGV